MDIAYSKLVAFSYNCTFLTSVAFFVELLILSFICISSESFSPSRSCSGTTFDAVCCSSFLTADKLSTAVCIMKLFCYWEPLLLSVEASILAKRMNALLLLRPSGPEKYSLSSSMPSLRSSSLQLLSSFSFWPWHGHYGCSFLQDGSSFLQTGSSGEAALHSGWA